MATAIADGAGLFLLVLLPFPVLALIGLLYALRLRRKLAKSVSATDTLAAEAIERVALVEDHEMRLEGALASHDMLTREFHHRVKNSLQIIQSYLTLSRRQKPAPHNIYLAEAESKVQVISTAYRMALRDGTMNSFPMRAFAHEIIENTQTILCGPFTKISALVELDCTIIIDRAIPLGLSIVEAITSALGAAGVMQIGIRIRGDREGEAELVITVDDSEGEITLPQRLMTGLQSQLGARSGSCAEGEILHWHFSL